MKILPFFKSKKEDGFTLYRLKEDEWDNFVKTLPEDFRSCYIEKEELKKKSKTNKITNSEFLEQYVVPDDGKIKSGDFGEIFCYFAELENLGNEAKTVVAPKKWRWKDKNKPAQYSDVILLCINDSKKDSSQDLLITIESKMKATKSKNHPIQDAIDGANDDKKSRMAKTLNWLVEKYARLGDVNSKKVAERFKDPASYGKFSKEHKAIAILDSDFENDEISKEIDNVNSLRVTVFSISRLKEAYEETRVKIIKSI